MNQRGFTNIVLIVLIVILTSAVGYFILTRKLKEKTTQATLPTQNQVFKNKTANWKTCENTFFGYEFSYPNKFQVTTSNMETNAGGDEKRTEPIPGCSDVFVFITNPSNREGITIYSNKAQGSYFELVFDFENRKDNSFPIEQLRNYLLRQGAKFHVKKEFIVQNERVIWMETNQDSFTGEQLDQYVPYIIFGHNQNIFRIKTVYAPVDETILENIVRSFVFKN